MNYGKVLENEKKKTKKKNKDSHYTKTDYKLACVADVI